MGNHHHSIIKMKNIYIQEKYAKARPQIKNGSLIAFRGDQVLAKLIQYFDDAYYNHIGIVFESEGHLMIIDSNRQGVKPDFLSERIRKYSDFCVLPPQRSEEEINNALGKAFERGDEGDKYDFLLLPRIAIVKKLNIDITGLGSQKRDICSEFVRFYTDSLNINCYKNIPLITPQDFIRYRNNQEVSLLFNDSMK